MSGSRHSTECNRAHTRHMEVIAHFQFLPADLPNEFRNLVRDECDETLTVKRIAALSCHACLADSKNLISKKRKKDHYR